MGDSTKFLATLLEDWYPDDYILAVIDDLAEAERAREALLRAGWAGGEMRLFRGHEAARQIDMFEKRRSLAERIAFAMRSMTSYESILGEDYAREVWRGHQLLVVYTPEPEQVEQVQRLLVAHHAHDIQHFGGVVITGLPHEEYVAPL